MRPVVSQAEAIKALTHPLRIRLLNLFVAEAELTATECAQRTGESVASCSFHLRQLEKYGHVERAQARGKERPWRASGRGYAVRADADDVESVTAAQAFASLWLTEQLARMQRWTAEIGRDDPAWIYASTQTSAEFWVTREELDELSRQVERLADRFADRSDNPDLRPAGARRAHLFGSAWAEIPDPDDGD
ncbi:ArsR/SmtB family transcription factor [Ornithinimicrobium panacihumi]